MLFSLSPLGRIFGLHMGLVFLKDWQIIKITIIDRLKVNRVWKRDILRTGFGFVLVGRFAKNLRIAHSKRRVRRERWLSLA